MSRFGIIGLMKLITLPRATLAWVLCALFSLMTVACGALGGHQQVASSGHTCPRPGIEDSEAVMAVERGVPQVMLSGVMLGRFAAAEKAMQAAAEANDQPTANCAAENVMYLLVGRFGRNAPPDALAPGILPADRETISDPGVAISAMSIMPDQPAVDLIAAEILGDPARWTTSPALAWSDLEAAVVSGRLSQLDGQAMQAIGYAMLIQRSSNLDEAKRNARTGVAVIRKAAEVSRHVLAINCASYPEAYCGVPTGE
jgi:hypothetical protein